MATKRTAPAKARASAAALLGVLAFSGCIQQYVWVDRVVMPAFDHSFIETIAVTEFTNRSSYPYAGKIVADRIEELLVNEGPYGVVPRQRLGRLGLPVGGRIDSKAAKRIGRVAGVDAIVLGTVELYEFEEVRSRRTIGEWLVHGMHGPKVARKASVLLYIKAVNAATGQVVWSKSASGSVRWTGWKDACSATEESEFLEEALSQALAEARSLFPHRGKVREPIM